VEKLIDSWPWSIWWCNPIAPDSVNSQKRKTSKWFYFSRKTNRNAYNRPANQAEEEARVELSGFITKCLIIKSRQERKIFSFVYSVELLFNFRRWPFRRDAVRQLSYIIFGMKRKFCTDQQSLMFQKFKHFYESEFFFKFVNGPLQPQPNFSLLLFNWLWIAYHIFIKKQPSSQDENVCERWAFWNQKKSRWILGRTDSFSTLDIEYIASLWIRVHAEISSTHMCASRRAICAAALSNKCNVICRAVLYGSVVVSM
jgi:hypothetical protein